MPRINTLTAEQQAQFPRYVREWTAIGTCTLPSDRPRAEAAIHRMYAIAGLAQPRIIWSDSPLSMCLTKVVSDSISISLRDSIRDSIRASVSDSVRGSISDSVRASVWASVSDSISDSVIDSVRASVWDSLRDSVIDSVRGSISDSISDSVSDSVRASVFGQHEAGWLAVYQYFRDECGLVAETDKLEGLWELAKATGWIIPCQGVCFASERHTVCKMDERGLIHAEDGPAVLYRDGFAVHAWHGQRVPKEWIEDKASVSAKDILGRPDGNLRAAGIQILGWARIVGELDAKVIDRHPEGMIGGELLAVKKSAIARGASGTMKILRAECPRNGIIAFRVPDEISKAHEAQAWAAGLPPSIYQIPAIRT